MCQADKMESPPKRVVVLISSLTGVNRSYKLRQNRAINVLEGRGHAYEIVNGADPEQKERRDELFRISGYQCYPQFFLSAKKGTTSYLGDFDQIEGLNDADGLPPQMLEENPDLLTLTRVMGDSSRSLLVLTTSLRINREVVQNQDRALNILKARNICFETIDGADPLMKERRNKLFGISGIRGSYPQFFIYDTSVYDKVEDVSFLGDWEKIEAVNDASDLPAEVLKEHPSIKTWDNLMGVALGAENN